MTESDGPADAILQHMAHARAGEIIQRIYDAEIHGSFSVIWTFDAGFSWELLMGPTERGGDADTFAEAARQMAEAVSEAHPDGPFARWWKQRR